jgi:glycosyltransferase involved in cell wall biosynthesis
MPTVLFLASTLDAVDGGIARSAPNLARAAHQAGLSVEVIGRRFRGELTLDPEGEAFPVTVLRGPTGLFTRLWPDRAFQALVMGRAGELAAAGPTILHHPGVWTDVNRYAAVVSRRLKIPLVCSPRGMLEPWSMNFHPIRKRIAWRLYAWRTLEATTVFHATAESEAEAIRGLGFRQPIRVVPNGVELPPNWADGGERRGRKRALFLSRIHQKKGLPMLLRAWSRIRPTGWELVIAGPDDGGHQAEIERLVETLGLGAEVSFPGSISDRDKWSLYRSADLFVLPTLSENFGMVVPEALACGLPVLTTTGAPWRELVERRCGWWVAPKEEAIAHALGAATEIGQEARRAMGARGRELVCERYTWPAIGHRMARMYLEISGGCPPSPD